MEQWGSWGDETVEQWGSGAVRQWGSRAVRQRNSEATVEWSGESESKEAVRHHDIKDLMYIGKSTHILHVTGPVWAWPWAQVSVTGMLKLFVFHVKIYPVSLHYTNFLSFRFVSIVSFFSKHEIPRKWSLFYAKIRNLFRFFLRKVRKTKLLLKPYSSRVLSGPGRSNFSMRFQSSATTYICTFQTSDAELCLGAGRKVGVVNVLQSCPV